MIHYMGKKNKNNDKNSKKGQKNSGYATIFKENDIVREFFRFLMEKFKIKDKVILVLRKNLVNYGYYSFNGDTHYIFIKSSECDACQCESGIHEGSHLLHYYNMMKNNQEDDKDPHCDEWGIWYSRVYRAYLEFLDIKEGDSSS